MDVNCRPYSGAAACVRLASLTPQPQLEAAY